MLLFKNHKAYILNKKYECNMIDLVIIIAVALFIYFEINLVSLNYLSRIKYSQHFREGEKFKAKLDRDGHKTFSVFVFPVVIKTCLFVFFILIYYKIDVTIGLCLIWFLLGLIFTNTLVDKITFEDKMVCVESGCLRAQIQSPCGECDVHDKYIFRLRLFQAPEITKKKEK